MNVADGFSCKRHYTNTVNCMLGTKTIRANPGRFACQEGYINCQVLWKNGRLTAIVINPAISTFAVQIYYANKFLLYSY